MWRVWRDDDSLAHGLTRTQVLRLRGVWTERVGLSYIPRTLYCFLFAPLSPCHRAHRIGSRLSPSHTEFRDGRRERRSTRHSPATRLPRASDVRSPARVRSVSPPPRAPGGAPRARPGSRSQLAGDQRGARKHTAEAPEAVYCVAGAREMSKSRTRGCGVA